jgi:hypothetical protein
LGSGGEGTEIIKKEAAQLMGGLLSDCEGIYYPVAYHKVFAEL